MEAAVRDLYRELKQKARGCRDRDVRIRLELVLLVIKLGNVSVACSRLGFSRKFYYKWWRRLKAAKYELWGLEEYSRRPKRSPKQIAKKLEQAIGWYARRQYGSRMIKAMLFREGSGVGKTTICHVLNDRRPPIKTRKNRLKKHRRRYELAIPGQRFQLDVKYVPEFVAGKRAYNYVIVDECTRWRYARAYDSLCEGTTVDFLESFKRHCPFPIHCIQTDNGQEFTYRLNPIAQHLEHKMDRWCDANGIRHQLIPPGVKELNGKVERSHRIDEQYFYWKAPTHSIAVFNLQQGIWMANYNGKRPHGGIEYMTPFEKLAERRQALKSEIIDARFELLRLKFLAEPPKEPTKQERQLLSIDALHLELKKRLNAA
jgi:transposase InsO family protein